MGNSSFLIFFTSLTFIQFIKWPSRRAVILLLGPMESVSAPDTSKAIGTFLWDIPRPIVLSILTWRQLASWFLPIESDGPLSPVCYQTNSEVSTTEPWEEELITYTSHLWTPSIRLCQHVRQLLCPAQLGLFGFRLCPLGNCTSLLIGIFYLMVGMRESHLLSCLLLYVETMYIASWWHLQPISEHVLGTAYICCNRLFISSKLMV